MNSIDVPQFIKLFLNVGHLGFFILIFTTLHKYAANLDRLIQSSYTVFFFKEYTSLLLNLLEYFSVI